MIKKAESFFEKYNVSLENKKLCVCFSGGSDSVALLLLTLELKKKRDFSLCAIHVNHHIRGKEADRDEEFCVNFCKEREIPLFVKHVDVISESEKTGEGLEETARRLRYFAFEELKREENIDYFLTAHHANDSAETVIFNILRGCGVSGITGIPPVRDFYLRPLIYCEKAEILAYLKEKNASFVEDCTNTDEDYTRNYIRNNLFPRLERVNSGFLGAISRLSESATADEEYFSMQINAISDGADLRDFHPAIASRYICRKYERLSGGEGLSAVHVKKILSLLDENEEKQVDVPFGITAIISSGKVLFQKKSRKQDFFTSLEAGKSIFAENTVITLEGVFEDMGEFVTHPTSVIIDGDKIKGRLFARKRGEGDCIVCRNMSRNVNKEFVNRKIPKHLRDGIPVICDDEGIVFVPFIGASDRVFTRGKIENPLKITVDSKQQNNL